MCSVTAKCNFEFILYINIIIYTEFNRLQLFLSLEWTGFSPFLSTEKCVDFSLWLYSTDVGNRDYDNNNGKDDVFLVTEIITEIENYLRYHFFLHLNEKKTKTKKESYHVQ